jgi:light-regulated signal transduction histidine kinase (bacteriophytochrome)
MLNSIGDTSNPPAASVTAGDRQRECPIEHNPADRNPEQSEVERLSSLVKCLSYALHGLGHDLREPIRTVSCYGEILRRSPAVEQDPNLLESVHFICGAAKRMDALSTGLLNYAVLIGEGFRPRPSARVDMNAVVQSALANLQLKIEESGAAVVCDPLPEVLGDQVQLAELMQNLLGNSIKYRAADPPHIYIRSERLVKKHLFSVEDNGIGIDSEHQHSIFTPFHRLHGQEFPGVGLGLAICRQIVELHRGQIWVESTAGKGSIFRFTLPAVTA